MKRQKTKNKRLKIKGFLFFSFFFFLFSLLQAQTKTRYDVDDFFKSDHELFDSLKTIHTHIRVISSPDSAADTIITRALPIQGGGGDLYLNTGRDTTNAAGEGTSGPWGQDTTEIWMAMFRGYGYPDSTGWEWKYLGVLTSNDSLQITLMDSTWNIKEPTDSVKMKWVEKDTVAADYWLNLWFFKWKP